MKVVFAKKRPLLRGVRSIQVFYKEMSFGTKIFVRCTEVSVVRKCPIKEDMKQT